MKSASVVQLLKVGHFLFEKQNVFKKLPGFKYDFFKEEINSLLHVILIHMGLIRGNEIVNTDNYEYVKSMFWTYCKNMITEEEMVDLIHVLKMDEVQIIETDGETISHLNSIDPLHVLLDLRKLIFLKRKKLNKFIDDLSDFIRAEMNIIYVALEEIGSKNMS